MKAYTGAHGYAFMSYSHKDEEKIKPLIEKLQSVGCNIWYDEGILPADEWAETIAKKLASASLFFLILSENAVASQNVKREIYFAVSHNLPILTFYLESVSLSQGLEMQLGISQAVHTKNDTEGDYAAIKSLFPKEAVGGIEPEIIHSTDRFHYGFVQQDAWENEFSILRIDRESRERRVLFRHRTNNWFVWYTLDSIHFSPRDEFNPTGKNVLYFTVNFDMDNHISGLDRYAAADFAIVSPEAEEAELVLLRGRTKRKEDSFAATVINEGPQIPWMKNMPKTEDA